MAEKPLRFSEVAARFGKSTRWLQRNIRRLQREHGFPQRIPGFGNVYDPLAIEGWLARQREPAATGGGLDFTLDPEFWARILDERAAALAPAAGHA